jgi:diguanylate cyclase (GGDEF)-like protein
MGVGEKERAGVGHLVFMVLFGLAGWSLLLAATWIPGLAPVPPRPAELVPFTLFFAVIAATRGLAFRVLPEILVSLDSAFYVAASACLGTVTAGKLVALALTLDALLRLLGQDRLASDRRSNERLTESLAFVVYYGGMTGGLLAAVGWLFQVDERALHDVPMGKEVEVVAVIMAAGATLLVLHYLIQGTRLRLAGTPTPAILRRMALPGILAEASLLPLGVVVVLIYNPEHLLGFSLLGATYVLVNFVFNRLASATRSLGKRVQELEALNRSARALGSTLQLADLLGITARELLAVVPGAEIAAIALTEGEGGGGDLIVDVYDRDKGEFARVRARAGEGLSGLVMRSGAPLRVGDLRRSEHVAGGDPGIRSWLGVPIVLYDTAVGVLSVQSREPGAFGPEEQRVLEAMAAQAGTAIQNARLYELATVDGLTGLFVRRYFDTRLREELERARRYGTDFSVLILDVDDFKRLNDTHGHAAGDKVLREVAHVIRRNMRGVDVPARYGGEEFAAILPRTSALDAHVVAERVRQDIAGTRVAVGEVALGVTVSVGVACFPDSGAESLDQLVALADQALYRAKQSGKNRVELA